MAMNFVSDFLGSLKCSILIAPESCNGLAYLGDPVQCIMSVPGYCQITTLDHHGKDVSFLPPGKARPDVDTKALTFAASSYCKPISRDRNLDFLYFIIQTTTSPEV